MNRARHAAPRHAAPHLHGRLDPGAASARARPRALARARTRHIASGAQRAQRLRLGKSHVLQLRHERKQLRAHARTGRAGAPGTRARNRGSDGRRIG